MYGFIISIPLAIAETLLKIFGKLIRADSVIICQKKSVISDGNVQGPRVRKEVVCCEMDCFLGVPDRQSKYFPPYKHEQIRN